VTALAWAIVCGYGALACLAAWRGIAWAGLAILAGLCLTIAARLALDPAAQFAAFGLIWCGIGAFVAVRGEGVIAALLIASGLCYFGADASGAVAPGWSNWFRASDAFGLAALMVVACGGDDGLVRAVRAALRLADHRGNSGYRPR
jgi:hypothetical protein